MVNSISRKKGESKLDRIIKIEKLEHCQRCGYFHYNIDTRGFVTKLNRYECHNPAAIRKNGSYRILNRKDVGRGLIPGWCPLEDYMIFRENNSI